MLKIGGVPEHFNLPWRDVLEARADEWIDFPGGSGAMARALGEGELDVAVMLTESAVRAIGDGLDAKIVGTHVASPLRWGIHGKVGADAEIGPQARFAISRIGSGSHLIPCVLADQRGWDVDALEFAEVGTIAGAREALLDRTADLFFWEQFMTQPLVDAGDFERIDVFLPPWPSFVVVMSAASESAHDVRTIIEDVGAVCLRMSAEEESTIDRVTREFGITTDDARRWLGLTDWRCEPSVSRAALESALAALHGAFGKTLPPVEELVDPSICEFRN